MSRRGCRADVPSLQGPRRDGWVTVMCRLGSFQGRCPRAFPGLLGLQADAGPELRRAHAARVCTQISGTFVCTYLHICWYEFLSV